MIELKAKSENYIPKEELEKAIKAIEKARGVVDTLTAEVGLDNLLTKDFEVIIEVEVDDIVDAAKAQDESTTLEDAVYDNITDDETVEALYESRELAKPLLASDFNSYDFKRKMCDLFETGYHVDSFDLVKLFAEKLKVDYLL